jgi:predicted secreted protein
MMKTTKIVLLGCLTSLPLMSLHAEERLNYNVVNLQAEAEREVANDQMHAVMYIEKSDKQPTQLANDLNTNINQALAKAKKYPQIKIETGAQSTYPIYDNENRKLKEWRGRNELRLQSTDFKAMSQLVSELQTQLQTASIDFSVSDQLRKKVENELMLEASKNFQQRAETLSKAWNKSGYQLVSLNINTNHYGAPVPRMAMMAKASSDAAIPEQSIAAGESKISVSANGAIQFK